MFDGGGASVAVGYSIEVGWVKWRSAVDGGGVHAVQMDPLIDRVAVGG